MPLVRDEFDVDLDNRIEDMICAIRLKSFHQAHVYDNLVSDANKPLYPGTKLKWLSIVLKLVTLKVRNGWTNKSLSELLELLKQMLLEGNTLLVFNY